MQKVISVARPNRKRRRTSKADAALEAGEDEIGFLADFPPLIPDVFLDLNLFLFLNFVEGENDVSDDGSPAISSDDASIHEVGGTLELTESDQLGLFSEPKKKWTSPIYSFFSNVTIFHKDDGSRYHLFKCASIRCKNNGPKSEHEDHAIRCFGQNVVDAAIRGDTTKNSDGLIFAAFARARQRPVDVTHRAHTNAEACGLRKHLVRCTLLKIAVSVPAPRSSDNFNSFQNLGAIEDEARDELSDYLAAPRVKTDDPMEWGWNHRPTSVAVEHVFSHGRRLLDFTHNHMSGPSFRRQMCLGSWGRKVLIHIKGLVDACTPANLKREVMEVNTGNEVEIVEK
ncbi:hypothetical protein DFH08DRAFT_1078523 [Mycena albidolilacea]|uniref:Uncharacterized protein n=1 Tax=Mycena albidolilacea TaxID=1033008 RepID=A0AAD7A934_9AGAR|nr:hypothetical protein DFH08DRAFT_1078523 [Mycena albidolilacea]